MRLLRICSRWLSLFLTCAAMGADSSNRGEAHGLGAAKEQLEALDADKSRELLGGRNNLPAAPLPTLDAAPSVPDSIPVIPRSRRLQLEKQQQSAAKSKNWLIEAMQENKGLTVRDNDKAQGSKRKEPSLKDEESLTSQTWLKAEAEEENDEGLDQAEAKARLASETVNPLSGYMATWMTPRDFHLLNAARADAAPSSESMNALTTPAVDFGIDLLQGTTAGDVSSGPSTLTSLNEPSSNPYLADTPIAPLAPVLPPEPKGSSAPVSLTDLNSAATTTLAPALEPQRQPDPFPATRAPLAESLRGSDDAKYFKQLKRF